MWNFCDDGPELPAGHGSEAALATLPLAEEELNSALSHDDASSGEEAGASTTTSAPRKRKRGTYLKTSCEMCRARKVKCDRAEPACSWCARHNRTCVYLERQKSGHRAGVNPELEAKVNGIYVQLQALGRRIEAHIAHDHVVATQQLSPSISAHSSAQADLSRSAPPFPAGSSLFASPGWQTDQNQERLRSPPPGDSQTASQNPPPNPDLPPHHMFYALLDLYFKHCNTWCPILDRKTTFDSLLGSEPLEESDEILLCAIVATTLRFSKDPQLTPEMKTHYHKACRRRVQIYALEHISVPALRAMVVVTLDELGTSNGPAGWNLLSLLAQNVKQLHLNEETSIYLGAEAQDAPHTGSIRLVAAGEPQSWIEDEGRRRLCWLIYLLDRYAAVATTTFNFMLDDHKMNRMLPCSYDLFSRNVPVETSRSTSCAGSQFPMAYAISKPENIGSFSYHCMIIRILSRVHDFLKTPVDITSAADMASWRNTYRLLDCALSDWLQSLSSKYGKISARCHSDPTSRVANWFILHSAHVTTVVRLHSSAAYPAVRSPVFVPSHYAMQKCLSAVKSLGDITQDVLEANGLALLGPHFAFSLWVAARLLLVHAATTGSLDPRISFFIDTLRQAGQHWEVANNYADILERLVRRERQGDMTFASMRRSAYDLVTLTSTTRKSGVENTSTQMTTLSELDNIDVFEFFNYPKLTGSVAAASNSQINTLQSCNQPSNESSGESRARINSVLNIDSDWLASTP